MSKMGSQSLSPTKAMTPDNQANLVAQVSDEVMKSLEPILESRFSAVLQSVAALAKLLEMNQSDDAKPVLQRNPVIRYVLDSESDQKRVRGMFESEILNSFQRAGEPFNQIIRVNYSGKELKFTAKSESAELRIRDVVSEISRHLDLSPNCRAIPMPYFVCVANVTHGECEQPRQFKNTWADKNGVNIANAFWTRQHLILTLFKLEHAKKLVSEGIFLSDRHFSYVTPFELHSVPKFCFKCYKPNHLKKECRAMDFRCGRCSGTHDTRDCRDPVARCPNCGKGHEAWFPQCSSKQVQDMRALCKQWEIQGPSWATLSVKEEMNKLIKTMTGLSQVTGEKDQPKKGKTKAKAKASQSQASTAGDDEPQPQRRGPGRPKGSKNKPREV